MTPDDTRRKHRRLPDDVPRKLHGPFKIDMPFEEAVRVGLGRWMPPRIASKVDHSRVVEWRPAGVGFLECPYCEDDVPVAEKHTCPNLNRTLVVPHYSCRMMRAFPKKPLK